MQMLSVNEPQETVIASAIASFDVSPFNANCATEINGTKLVADTIAVADANAEVQCEWAPITLMLS